VALQLADFWVLGLWVLDCGAWLNCGCGTEEAIQSLLPCVGACGVRWVEGLSLATMILAGLETLAAEVLVAERRSSKADDVHHFAFR
jgi:hypothetical protein